ncbi:1,3,7-trimethyluric acid N-methyltransferase CkTcS-like [Silene latifolia]|uniref:1,3,7-trimethyluric acid N-methyltransferase CkTcS-like n=1 Tax=Silene latifolia TaxID=37657 RepID=UPI003D76F5A4
MNLKDVLHMKEGDGEFSYAHNCTIQEKIFSGVNKPMVERALRSLLLNDTIRQSRILNVADLGCSIGPSPINLISLVSKTVESTSKELNLEDDQVPEIQMYMNDLPTNDFNLLFKTVGTMQVLEHGTTSSCFVVGVPGSFYGRLLPRNSVHFVHSNYALQWLSKVPQSVYDEVGNSMNKESITISESSPPNVVKAYKAQFQQDSKLFLGCRSSEVVPNGYMLLALKGSPSIHPQLSCTSRLLYRALSNLVSKGLIKENVLESFDMPLYFPAKEEIQSAITEEGSFEIEKMEGIVNHAAKEIENKQTKAETIAKTIRAFSETLVSLHFGENIWNVLFDELAQVTLKHLEVAPVDGFSIIILLKKKLCIETSSRI